jgi:PadR family transcriptional regulator PadR
VLVYALYEHAYQITTLGLRHLERQISSFERMFEGIMLVLDPAKGIAG